MKRFINVIACCVFVIILSACSDNLNGSNNYEYQDLGRSCSVSGCWNDAAPGEIHCGDHIAEANGEIDLCKYNGCTSEAFRDGYCATHKVSQANEGYYTCIVEGCMEKAGEDSIRCALHSY